MNDRLEGAARLARAKAMVEATTHLRELVKIAGSDPTIWGEIDGYLAVFRPAQKRKRKMKDGFVRFLAYQAHEDAPFRNKKAAEAKVYKDFEMKVPNEENAKQIRRRIRAKMKRESREELKPWLDKIKKRGTDK